MGPRRRRWLRKAAKAALAALGLAVLALLGSGRGEELLAAALAAWGEGRGAWGGVGGGGEWGMGVGDAGGAEGGSWGGGFMNGGRGNGAGFVNGERGKGAGLARRGAGLASWGAEVPDEGAGVLNGSSRVTNGGPGGGIGGPGAGIGGHGAGIGSPGVGIRGPGGGIWGPGAGIGSPGVGVGSPGVAIGGPASPSGGPQPPPSCLGLLSGGSGDLPEGPPTLPRTPKVLLSPAPCAPPPPFLLILVPSALPHRERRLAVRDTWGGPWRGSAAPPARTVFVLGSSSSSSQRDLLAESRQHGDILQGDFADTYGNLTWKTLLLLRWARACCAGAPFLLKADDDVFVNVPAVATYLATWQPPPPRLYLGRVHWRVKPNRDPRSRHHVPAGIFGAGRFPPYCSGTAYVLSRQAATALLAQAPRVPLALPEDAWVGVLAERAGVPARHSARFGGSWRVPPEGCCLGRVLFSAHRVRPREMRGVWEGVAGGERGCGALREVLGVLRCRVLALREWVWGGE